MSVINTNIKSTIAQNALTVNNRAMSKTMEQLSTGKRINSAADDAAGLAIGSKMTAQIKGLNQAVRNANDGISLLQTADGAMIEVTNMLQRMRELAVQSANDTNTTDDREYLDNEFQQLKVEINRIAENTQWNGMNILNNASNFGTDNGGTSRTVSFQVGANADSNQKITANFKDFTFTPSSSTANPSVKQYDLAVVSESIVGFQLTIDTTTISEAVTTTALTATAGEAATSELDTLASRIQTAVNGNSGFENIVVARDGTNLKVTDSTGRVIGALDLNKTALGTPAGTTNTATNIVTGGTTGGSAGTGVFGGAVQIHNANIRTLGTSETSITELDDALKAVNSERSMMGAVINRLTYAADNLANVSQNTSASRSQIMDTDYASATTELARTQIISQAATAMLAQANQAPQSVLSLLR
jgi:flagellin